MFALGCRQPARALVDADPSEGSHFEATGKARVQSRAALWFTECRGGGPSHFDSGLLRRYLELRENGTYEIDFAPAVQGPVQIETAWWPEAQAGALDLTLSVGGAPGEMQATSERWHRLAAYQCCFRRSRLKRRNVVTVVTVAY